MTPLVCDYMHTAMCAAADARESTNGWRRGKRCCATFIHSAVWPVPNEQDVYAQDHDTGLKWGKNLKWHHCFSLKFLWGFISVFSNIDWSTSLAKKAISGIIRALFLHLSNAFGNEKFSPLRCAGLVPSVCWHYSERRQWHCLLHTDFATYPLY